MIKSKYDETKTKLNLGCGADYKQEWLNVDFNKSELGKEIKVDFFWDLNKFPYPFKNNQFEEVFMGYVLEYLDDPIKVLKELVRICKKDAKITLYVVHARAYSATSHLNFKSQFTENTFIGNRLTEYQLDKNLELVTNEPIYIHRWKKLIPLKKTLKLFLCGIYDAIKIEFRVKK